MFEGPEEQLRLTEHAQPALMATSLAAVRALEARSGRRLAELCGVVAGHSLGEYSALAAAGSLAIGDAARLLRVRGRAMQEAVPVGEGAMAAILGLELEQVEAGRAGGERDRRVRPRQRQRARPGRGQRQPGRGRARGGSGQGAGRAPQRAVAGQRAVPLPPAGAGRRGGARGARRHPDPAPAVPVVTNVTARPKARRRRCARAWSSRSWRGCAGARACSPWRSSASRRPSSSAPGKVLSGLAKRTLPGIATSALGTPEEIDAFVANLAG